MENKEYPMDEDYNQALAFLVEMIAERDQMLEDLKKLSPADRPEGLRLLGELNKAIERGEQALATEYESTQTLRRAEEKRDEVLDDLTEGLAGAYVHCKYRNPEAIPQLEATIAKMEPEQIKDFYDRAAQLESGDLVRIIRRKGETVEEAEEFLENYRADLFEDIAERMAAVYIHMKYRHPDSFEKLKAELFQDYTPEEKQNFFDRVARLEADDLIGLIARKGETREQTEEFLKNYLAEQNKQL